MAAARATGKGLEVKKEWWVAVSVESVAFQHVGVGWFSNLQFEMWCGRPGYLQHMLDGISCNLKCGVDGQAICSTCWTGFPACTAAARATGEKGWG